VEWWELELDSHHGEEFMPKSDGEHRVMITDNRAWDAIKNAQATEVVV
jgi:hypothetical protein